ncbi:hypothetical protein KQX54_011052 [Cotesia glomerata]|uniref:Uncharacterized protein n=1 Tax=Cotesia glomerata TaxID=32391 RepID=A0AAV7J7D0_COTGL|nr:hypothetical protein KQX54_011052 [Cotesia glomerata]
MSQDSSNTTDSQKKAKIHILKTIEPLSSFIKEVKIKIKEFREEFVEKYELYLTQVSKGENKAKNPLDNVINNANNEYFQKYQFPTHQKIGKLYDKTKKSLNGFIRILLKDYAKILSMATELNKLKSEHAQLAKKFTDHKDTYDANQLYQLIRDIENVIEQHNKLVTEFNTGFEKFYALKLNLSNGILAYTSLKNKTITFSNESELAEFQRLIEADETLKKRFAINKSFADKLKTTLVNSADKTVLLHVTPLKEADWTIGSEVPNFSPGFKVEQEPMSPNPESKGQSDGSMQSDSTPDEVPPNPDSEAQSSSSMDEDILIDPSNPTRDASTNPSSQPDFNSNPELSTGQPVSSDHGKKSENVKKPSLDEVKEIRKETSPYNLGGAWLNGAESRIALELPGRYKLARNERQIASELSARLPRRDRSPDRIEAGGGDAAPSSAPMYTYNTAERLVPWVRKETESSSAFSTALLSSTASYSKSTFYSFWTFAIAKASVAFSLKTSSVVVDSQNSVHFQVKVFHK